MRHDLSKFAQTIRSLSLLLIPFLLAFGLYPGIVAGQLFNDNLDSTTNVNWTVVNSSNASAIFGFDYSAMGIPSAPNGSGTLGMKLEVNNSGTPGGTGGIENITVVNKDDNYTGHYFYQVDIWQNWALDLTDPEGVDTPTTTEFSGVSIGHDAIAPGLWGASFIYSGDGGSNTDYRLGKNFNEQSPTDGQYAIGDQPGDNDNTNPIFTDVWTGIDVDLATNYQQEVTGVTTPAGTTGFQWMTLLAEVDTDAVGVGITDDPGIVTFTLTSDTFNQSIEIGTLDNSNGGTVVDFNSPGETRSIALMASDFLSGISLDPQYSFTLFDNVVVSKPDSADFDADGDIDGTDFLSWQLGAGIADGSALFEQGDANYDGNVDALDLSIWQEQVGLPPSAMASTAMASTAMASTGGALSSVPEPATALMVVWSLAAILIQRRTRPDVA